MQESTVPFDSAKMKEYWIGRHELRATFFLLRSQSEVEKQHHKQEQLIKEKVDRRGKRDVLLKLLGKQKGEKMT